jgi:hypothetical protein
MGLQEQLNKTYFHLKQTKSAENYEFVSEIGALIQKMCSQRSNDANEEFISSLLFPYLSFVFSIVTSESHLPLIIEE